MLLNSSLQPNQNGLFNPSVLSNQSGQMSQNGTFYLSGSFNQNGIQNPMLNGPIGTEFISKFQIAIFLISSRKVLPEYYRIKIVFVYSG